ncbi:MAG: sortase [Chloroflexi bacterium]|nr:sortase [Chloroflexota bacterium]
MASKTDLRRLAITFSLLLLIVATLIPNPVAAASALPDLKTFISSVENGNADSLSGVYVDGAFALSVVQQPPSNAGYVSTIANTVTQFGLATQYGNVGLLAHNYLSGQFFLQLIPGERVVLIYGDGSIQTFRITHIYRYQATEPNSTRSNFIDLNTGEKLTADQLFAKVYTGAHHVTFQTCIANNGNSSWGRLFVIAEPATNQASPPHWN